MDVNDFILELLRALTTLELVGPVDLSTDGPVAQGHIYVRADFFVRFYFNQITQTVAFALIKENRRVWGIDRDSRRDWHLHPVGNPGNHIVIAPLSVTDIVAQLRDVLVTLVDSESSNR
ncbi:MAG: hypothetical protein JXA33_02940 [Anaerolineae bacterium]|nr:hypothetical protein [Anaerolineae bacterium]